MNTLFSVLLAVTAAWFGVAAAAPQQPQVTEAAAHDQVVKPPYPSEVQKALNQIRKTGGHQVTAGNEMTYVAISLGERPTGGYLAVLERVEQQADGTWVITVREQKPAAGAMKTQVITYPTLVVALPGKTDAVQVIRQS